MYVSAGLIRVRLPNPNPNPKPNPNLQLTPNQVRLCRRRLHRGLPRRDLLLPALILTPTPAPTLTLTLALTLTLTLSRRDLLYPRPPHQARLLQDRPRSGRLAAARCWPFVNSCRGSAATLERGQRARPERSRPLPRPGGQL